MWKLVIFDLDGTLLYTLEDLTDGVNYALSKFGFKEKTLEEIRSCVGNGIRNLIKRVLPKDTLDIQQEEVLKCFKEYYTINCNNKTRPYDGIIELLKSLKEKGIITAIVSNKNDEAVKRLKDIYFGKLIDYAEGNKKGRNIKPDAGVVNNIINESNLNKHACVYIGDSDVDYYTAKNAGIKSILVSWGFRDRKVLEGLCEADIIDSVSDLKSYLLGNE